MTERHELGEKRGTGFNLGADDALIKKCAKETGSLVLETGPRVVVRELRPAAETDSG